MDIPKVYDSIYKEYGHHIAIHAVILVGMNVSIMPTKKDMKAGRYENKLLKIFDNLLWELSNEDKELCLKIWRAWYNFQVSQELGGFVGCEKQTLKELVEKENDIMEKK